MRRSLWERLEETERDIQNEKEADIPNAVKLKSLKHEKFATWKLIEHFAENITPNIEALQNVDEYIKLSIIQGKKPIDKAAIKKAIKKGLITGLALGVFAASYNAGKSINDAYKSINDAYKLTRANHRIGQVVQVTDLDTQGSASPKLNSLINEISGLSTKAMEEPYISIPSNKFKIIFRNGEFQKILKRKVLTHEVTLANAISLAEATYREMIKKDGVFNVSRVGVHAEKIIETMYNKEVQEIELMGPNTKLLYIGGASGIFREQRERVLKLFSDSGGQDENVIGVFSGMIDEKGNPNQPKIFDTIKRFDQLGKIDKDYDLLIFFDLHGNAGSLTLDESKLGEDLNMITAGEIAQRIRGLDLFRIKTISESCLHYDFNKKLDNELAQLGIKNRPLVRITAANKGRSSFGSSILDSLEQAIRERSQGQSARGLILGDYFRHEEGRNVHNDPSITVCLPPSKECLEIGGSDDSIAYDQKPAYAV